MTARETLDGIRAQLAAKLPEDARMDAYYYGFDRTGVAHVDAILSAVAVAGKGSHHTESWGNESEFGYYANRPGLPSGESAVDLIQKAADIGARNFTDAVARLSNAVEAVLALHQPLTHHFLTPPAGSVEVCHSCREEYPCPTVAAIENALKEGQ